MGAEAASTPEVGVASVGEAFPVAPAVSVPTPVSMPAIDPSVATPITASPVAQTAAGNPVVADDTDLIEKEWVTKAKKIVEATKEDPYQQTKELTSFKADYMQKRYNKTLKVSE